MFTLGRESLRSQTSLSQIDDSGTAAPGSSVPSVQAPSTKERKSSIASLFDGSVRQRRASQRPQREPRKPPLSFRSPSSLTSASGVHHGSVGEHDEEDELNFSVERHDRAGSISSNHSQRGVDLLDAADGIRTIDFRSRLQATGAKDFGEDVADRNIREHSAGDPQTMSNPARGRRIIVARDSFNSRSGLSGGPGAVTPGSRTVSSSSIIASPENSDPVYLTTQYLKSGLRASFFPDETIEPGSFSRRNKNRLSLNTYTPSGLEPPPLTPRSYVTTPGMNDAAKAGGPSSPGAGPEGLAGKYFISPTDSSFSLPSSPHSVSSPTRNYAGPEEADEESNWEREQQLGDVSASRTLTHLRKPIGNVGHTKRYSVQTLRSSLSSTITSRYPSGADFIPLGYPRMRSNSLAEINRPVEGDEGPSRRKASFRKLDPRLYILFQRPYSPKQHRTSTRSPTAARTRTSTPGSRTTRRPSGTS